MTNRKQMSDKTKNRIKTVAVVIISLLFVAIISIMVLASLHFNVNPLEGLQPYVKFILPIVLILLTSFAGFVIAIIFADHFNNWIRWDTLQGTQTQIMSVNATIIAGLFILLSIVFQSQSISTHDRSWIILITAPTVFPFVASIMLLTFFGFASVNWYNKEKKQNEVVPQWQAKMGILLMVFGFLWIMGDLIAILFLSD
jgi:hypothetical protein